MCLNGAFKGGGGCFFENADDAAQREENTLYFWYCSITCLHLSAGCVYVHGRRKP